MLQVAFATDKNCVEPACVAIHSMLRHRKGPTKVIVLGVELTSEHLTAIQRTVATFPDAVLDIRAFELPSECVGAMAGHVTATSFARLFLPEWYEGRVIYLDIDTVTQRDVVELWEFDLDGHAVAAALDLSLQMSIFLQEYPQAKTRDRLRATEQLKKQSAVLPNQDLKNYFNAGVLVLDCDRLKENDTLYSALKDIRVARTYPLLDQDHLNSLLPQGAPVVPANWNRFVGNIKERVLLPYLRSIDQAGPAGLLHFCGPVKPWHAWRNWRVKCGPANMLKWRIARMRWRRDLKRGQDLSLSTP